MQNFAFKCRIFKILDRAYKTLILFLISNTLGYKNNNIMHNNTVIKPECIMMLKI